MSPRAPTPTWFIALVVVRLGRRFLVVQENKPGHAWYLPAGRVEPGETVLAAALRETLEEAGVSVVLEGVVRVELTPQGDGGARCRVLFVARPADDMPPKSAPDAESLRAAWCTLEEVARLPLRHPEVLEIFDYVARGGAIHPLNVLAYEGQPIGVGVGAEQE